STAESVGQAVAAVADHAVVAPLVRGVRLALPTGGPTGSGVPIGLRRCHQSSPSLIGSYTVVSPSARYRFGGWHRDSQSAQTTPHANKITGSRGRWTRDSETQNPSTPTSPPP